MAKVTLVCSEAYDITECCIEGPGPWPVALWINGARTMQSVLLTKKVPEGCLHTTDVTGWRYLTISGDPLDTNFSLTATGVTGLDFFLCDIN